MKVLLAHTTSSKAIFPVHLKQGGGTYLTGCPGIYRGFFMTCSTNTDSYSTAISFLRSPTSLSVFKANYATVNHQDST